MILRGVQFLVGAALAGGAGWLIWLNRGLARAVFPPDAGAPTWLLIVGLAGAMLGLVLAADALAPRTALKARLAEEAARRQAAILAADAFYAERSRAADRDWRSGPLPPEAAPSAQGDSPYFSLAAMFSAAPEAPAPSPAAAPPQEAAPGGAAIQSPRAFYPVFGGGSGALSADPAPGPLASVLAPQRMALAGPEPAPAAPVALEPVFVQAVENPVPASLPPLDAAAAIALFSVAPEPPPPATTLGIEPDAAPAFHILDEPVTTPAPVTPAPSSGALPSPIEDIRAAIAANQLETAEALLNAERIRLSAAGDLERLGMAELTGLAGDHAAAAGRIGGAKWLWRLALQRFADADAIANPAARAVSERLRMSDQ